MYLRFLYSSVTLWVQLQRKVSEANMENSRLTELEQRLYSALVKILQSLSEADFSRASAIREALDAITAAEDK